MMVDTPPRVLSFDGERLELIERSVNELLASRASGSSPKGYQQLVESMKYSLSAGGKRTRPMVGLLVSEQWGMDPRRVMPWLLAVEMIHTYSLIHDDLPCMDNDDVRRGRPTNHKVFGEATALLAGDTLLTEAFGWLARNSKEAAATVELVCLLAEAAGLDGMTGGQAIDLESKSSPLTADQTLEMQAMKTGALFRVICEGVAVSCGMAPQLRQGLRDFGARLGACFQLTDDLLDSKDTLEPGSLPALWGRDATASKLKSETSAAIEVLASLGVRQGPLVELVRWNERRLQ